MPDTQRLTEAMMTAHFNSALNNENNLSSALVKQMATAGKSFTEAVASAILSLGGSHGPVTQARNVLYRCKDDEIQSALEQGIIIPGFGNDFYKDRTDPSWDDFKVVLQEDFPSYTERIESVAKLISEHKGKVLFPNPASYTATVAELLDMPVGTEVSLLIQARMPAWVNQWSMACK